jgi:hypothetical protein
MNLLDVYRPRGVQEFPVVLLVHGGAWVAGDKSLDFIPKSPTNLRSEVSASLRSATDCHPSPVTRHMFRTSRKHWVGR